MIILLLRSENTKKNLDFHYKKIILYAPTWRDNEYSEKGKYKFASKLDFDKAKEALSDEYIFIVKYHYLVSDKIDWTPYKGFVYTFDETKDIAWLYLVSDMLITDYSSVMFDYSILNRPMLFFAYDLEDYKENLRGFYFDFVNDIPGPISRDTDQLIKDIKEYNEDCWKEKYKNYHDKFNVANRIVTILFSNLLTVLLFSRSLSAYLLYHVNDLLLATLNGEDYLKAQLESIAAQTYENWQLVVGDDGSTDGTISILEEFSKQYPEQVTIIKNDPPQGSAKDNFISLIQNSYGPYFMFCDQDDVWKPDKIYLTLQKMEALEARYGEKTPILVHSDLSVADHNLEMVAESFFQYANIPKRIVLNQLMVQNSVTGCTMMINRCLQQYFLRPLPMSKIIMHDYWAALIAKVFGKIGFVNEPTMYYRQHGNNSVGAKDAKNPVFLYHRLKEVHKHPDYQSLPHMSQQIPASAP